MLRALSLAWSLGLGPAETPSDDASVAAPPPEPSAPPAEASTSTPEADAAAESDVAAPPMPEVEEIPTHDEPPARRKLFDRSPDPARDPAGSRGGSFFDPGRLEDTGPAGGLLQIRGYVAANFFVATRSNTARRGPDRTFPDLKPMPFFDVSSAALYVGAPIWTDVIYARISLEFVSLPQTQVTTAQPDIIAQANRRLFFEAAALEVNPFAWAKKTDRWFREGFKITGGVMLPTDADWQLGQIRAWPGRDATWLFASGSITSEAQRGVFVARASGGALEVCGPIEGFAAHLVDPAGDALQPFALAVAEDGAHVAVGAGPYLPPTAGPGYGKVLWGTLTESDDPCATTAEVIDLTAGGAGAPAVDPADPSTFRRAPHVLSLVRVQG